MSAKSECASGASCDDKPGVGERGFSRFGIWMTFKFIMTATRRFMQTTSQCPVVGKRDVIGFFPVACHSRGFPTGSKRDWKAHSYCSVSRKFVSLARLQLYGDEVAGKVLAGELIGLADLVLQASGSQLHRIAAVPVAPREGVNVRRSEE